MSMITATAWVPRGFAAQFPTQYNPDDEEVSRIYKLGKIRLDDAKEDLKAAQESKEPSETGDEDSDDEEAGVKLPQSKG